MEFSKHLNRDVINVGIQNYVGQNEIFNFFDFPGFPVPILKDVLLDLFLYFFEP